MPLPRPHNDVMSPPLLCTLGHVATARELTGWLRTAVRDGRAIRLRRGVYACPHLDGDIAAAARVGGALSCVSVLRAAGVWAGHSRRLHVQVPPTASCVRPGGARIHWEHPRFAMESPWRTGRLQALWQAMRCLDEENAIAAMESAVHEGFLPLDEVRRLGRLGPRRLQDGIRRLVPNSGSGNETIVRLRLERAGYRVEAQAPVPGMGHEDLLVEGCVGIDVDGRRWHGEDRFAIDRDRDLHVEGLGRHVLRLHTGHIFDTWPHTLTVIERVVADSRRNERRRVVIPFTAPID